MGARRAGWRDGTGIGRASVSEQASIKPAGRPLRVRSPGASGAGRAPPPPATRSRDLQPPAVAALARLRQLRELCCERLGLVAGEAVDDAALGAPPRVHIPVSGRGTMGLRHGEVKRARRGKGAGMGEYPAGRRHASRAGGAPAAPAERCPGGRGGGRRARPGGGAHFLVSSSPMSCATDLPFLRTKYLPFQAVGTGIGRGRELVGCSHEARLPVPPRAGPLPLWPRAPQVGAVEGRLEHDAARDAELLAHVVLHARRGGRGQRHDRDLGEAGGGGDHMARRPLAHSQGGA